jgi:type VI secretion system protein
MQKLRLLERLRTHDPNWRQERSDEMEQIVASVRGHIGKLLDTRQGSAIIGEQIGTPDYNAITMNYTQRSRQELEAEIRALIERFEPRLGNITITHEGVTELTGEIKFRIEGVITGGNSLQHVGFNTMVNKEGKFSLRESHS